MTEPRAKKIIIILIIGGTFYGLSLKLWTLFSGGQKFTLEDPFVRNSTYEGNDFQDLLFSKVLQDYKIKHSKILTLKQDNYIPTFFLYTTAPKSTFWKEGLKDISNGNCALPCNFTTDLKNIRSVDAVIYLRELKNTETLYKVLGPRNPNQPWVMLSYENHIRARNVFHIDYHSLNGVFNRTMFYRRDSDVITNHGFIVSNEDANYLPESWHLPVYRNDSLSFSNKIMAVGMISNCHDNTGRLTYIKELSQKVKVDIYGMCGRLKCGGPAYVQNKYKVNTHKCFKLVGKNYLFYLAFENSICNDYVTEKIYNILYYPIIPVVLGGGAFKDILPPHSYIDATHMPPSQLGDLMLYLRKHPKMYLDYFKWKDYYKPSTIGGVRIMCHLCHRLHDQEFYKYNVVEDFYDWFVNKSECIDGHKHPPWLNHAQNGSKKSYIN